MSFLSAMLLFGFLIFIHELGHFLFAKLSNVKVLKFSLGFGPKIVGRKIGETEYMLSAVPLGGYVKMLGEEVEDEVEQSDMARSFKNQPIHKRAAIILFGPLFNIFTAVVIFFFVFLLGVPTLLPVVGDVMKDTPAESAGLQKGDRIVQIDDAQISQWSEMTEVIHKSPDKLLNFKIKRAEELIDFKVTPQSKKTKDIFGEEKTVGLIGIKPLGDTIVYKESLAGSVKQAFLKTWEISVLTVVGMVKLIQRIVPADNIGGPILIFQLAEKQANAGFLSYFTFAAVISINLGVLNLLPIPVLDGGHLVFLGIEALRKKPLSEKIIIISQKVGIALLVMLMAFAMYNDIFRIITGKPLP
ncbi:MAG: RIP metalloprotease RseP [Nitrospirae bacterium]|nr:RIP metalloprotease RseP [Nitrospirota bacterium]